MKNKFYNVVLAGCLILCINSFGQDLAKDSIKVQKFLKEAAKGKKAPAIFTITDKEKVAFISQYIDAKKLEEQKAIDQYKLKTEATLGGSYLKGDKSKIPQIVSILKGRDKDKVFDVINELDTNDFMAETQPLYLDPEIKSEIFKLITDEEFENRVIQFLGYNKVDGRIALFEDRLLSGKSGNNERLFFWLARDGKSEKAVNYFISQFENTSPVTGEQPWFTEGLPYFLEDGSEPIKKKILDFCFSYMEAHPLTLANMMKDTEDGAFDPQLYIAQVILTSDDKRVPAFSDKMENTINKVMPKKEKQELHEVMQLNLLRFYDFPKKKETVLQTNSSKDDLFDFVSRVSKDKTLINDKDVALHLFRKFDEFGFDDDYEAEQFVKDFIGLDRETFKSVAASAIKSAERRENLTAYYTIQKQTIAETNDYLFKNGLIAKPITQEQINSIPKDNLYPDGSAIYNSLELAQISLNFDTEPNVYPADHDVLLLELAKKSQGKLQGIKAYQQSKYDEKSETSEITLFAVYNNKCFVMMPTDLGDWYDVETFDNLLKAIVAEAGIKERFVPLNTGDQNAWYIFGEGEKVGKLVSDYKLEYTESTGDEE